MWIDLLKGNLKELLQLLVKSPIAIMLLLLMFTSGFFANKWVESRDNCDERISRIQYEKDSISGVAFERLMLVYKEREIRDIENKQIDSILRSRMLELIKDNNVGSNK